MMGMDMPLGERLPLCLASAVGAAFSFLNKRSMLACAVVASALLLAGCFTRGRGVARESGLGSGGVTAERRDVQPFDAVRLNGCANLVVRVSQVSSVSVNVTADSGLRSRIATRVENGTLVIKTVREPFQSTCGVRIDISVPALRRLVLYGAGHAAVDGQGAREDGPFGVEIDGSASARWSGTATALDAAVRGSGEVRLEGQAESLRASIDGSGMVDARALSVAEAGLEVRGTGQVRWGSATPQAKAQAGAKEPGSSP
jgi:hypothetical protein